MSTLAEDIKFLDEQLLPPVREKAGDSYRDAMVAGEQWVAACDCFDAAIEMGYIYPDDIARKAFELFPRLAEFGYADQYQHLKVA